MKQNVPLFSSSTVMSLWNHLFVDMVSRLSMRLGLIRFKLYWNEEGVAVW